MKLLETLYKAALSRGAAALAAAALLFAATSARAQFSAQLTLGVSSNSVGPLVTNTVAGPGLSLTQIGPRTNLYCLVLLTGTTNGQNNYASYGSNFVTLQGNFDTNSGNANVAGTWFQPTANYSILLTNNNGTAALTSVTNNAVASALVSLDVSGVQYIRESSWGNTSSNLMSTNLAIILFSK